MVLWVSDNDDLAAAFAHDVAFGNIFRSVVGALCMKIRSDRPDQFLDRRLIEDCDKVHASKAGYDLRPLAFGRVWPPIALQNSRLVIRVDADHQDVAERFSPSQITNVSNMQEVKTAVRKDDDRSSRASNIDLAHERDSFENRCAVVHYS